MRREDHQGCIEKIAALERDLAAAQARIAILEEASRVWEKESLVALVEERRALRERVATLVIERDKIEDRLSVGLDNTVAERDAAKAQIAALMEAGDELLQQLKSWPIPLTTCSAESQFRDALDAAREKGKETA